MAEVLTPGTAEAVAQYRRRRLLACGLAGTVLSAAAAGVTYARSYDALQRGNLSNRGRAVVIEAEGDNREVSRLPFDSGVGEQVLFTVRDDGR